MMPHVKIAYDESQAIMPSATATSVKNMNKLFKLNCRWLVLANSGLA